MLTVGLTGGIGVGKTVCAQIFDAIGVPIYNSDKEAKLLMVNNGDVKSGIIELFGDDSYKSDGSLNRAHLASIIFKDKSKLEQMNAIVHPEVRDDFAQWCMQHNEHNYVIQESALLFETGSFKLFDKIILVHAPEEIRIQRVIERDDISEDEVKARMSKQLSQEDKLEHADYVIMNDGQHSIVRQVIDIHLDLIQ